jgi:hypothetical protein
MPLINSKKAPSTLKVIAYILIFIDEGGHLLQDKMIVKDMMMVQSIENEDDEDDEFLLESGLRPFDEREQN